MNILFWDIDGTLIRTSKAGLFALEQAVQELWAKKVDFDRIYAAGMTDNYIAGQIIAQLLQREATAAEIHALCRRYEELLAVFLQQRDGWLLPSVREILQALADRPDYASLLLTGNSPAGAKIKMQHFGLAQYFDFSCSAFCDAEVVERVDIARQARKNVEETYGSASEHRLFVIGDTPNDIACGKAIGAYTIGVATGGYELPALVACEPWWALPELPTAAVFLEKLGLK